MAHDPSVPDVFWHNTKDGRPVLVAVNKQEALSRLPPWDAFLHRAIHATPREIGQRKLSLDNSTSSRHTDNFQRYLVNQYGFGKCNLGDLAPGCAVKLTGKSLLWCYKRDTMIEYGAQTAFGPDIPLTLTACEDLRRMKKENISRTRTSEPSSPTAPEVSTTITAATATATIDSTPLPSPLPFFSPWDDVCLDTSQTFDLVYTDTPYVVPGEGLPVVDYLMDTDDHCSMDTSPLAHSPVEVTADTLPWDPRTFDDNEQWHGGLLYPGE